MRLTAHAAWTIPFNSLNGLYSAVQRDDFDRYLIRPTLGRLDHRWRDGRVLTSTIPWRPFAQAPERLCSAPQVYRKHHEQVRKLSTRNLSSVVRFVLTFVLPLAFVAYLPVREHG